MSTPTEYDLVQDQKILPMQQILSQAAEPPTGSEFSYPVVGQGISSSMWQWITKGVGNGVIDLGDYPYTLENLNNATNSGVLKVGQRGTANAIVEGFYHQLSEDMTVSLPMPSSGTTTYSVCLTHDPRNGDSAGGPISVQVYSGTPPTTFGRVHVVLWTVRRSANQLLTDATVERIRPRVAPVIYVWAEDHKPDPAQQLWGTLCVVGSTAAIYRATSVAEAGGDGGARAWVSLTDPPWVEYGDTPTYVWPGHGQQRAIQRVGKRRRLRGRVSRRDGSAMTPSSVGYLLWTCGPDDIPGVSAQLPVVCGSSANPKFGLINIVQGSAEIRLYPAGTIPWLDLSAVQWDV